MKYRRVIEGERETTKKLKITQIFMLFKNLVAIVVVMFQSVIKFVLWIKLKKRCSIILRSLVWIIFGRLRGYQCE